MNQPPVGPLIIMSGLPPVMTLGFSLIETTFRLVTLY